MRRSFAAGAFGLVLLLAFATSAAAGVASYAAANAAENNSQSAQCNNPSMLFGSHFTIDEVGFEVDKKGWPYTMTTGHSPIDENSGTKALNLQDYIRKHYQRSNILCIVWNFWSNKLTIISTH